MRDSLQKSLEELRAADIIDEATEARIREFYERNKTSPTGKIILGFSILGALLVGLGIILLIAHNWDEFSRPVKTVIAFFPLITSQALCGYCLVRRSEAVAWRETTSVLLMLTAGACTSLVSQIYNIQGSLSSFLFTWMLLCFPVSYLMRSTMASLLYIGNITWYGILRDYDFMSRGDDYWYWFLLLLILPYSYFLVHSKASRSFLLWNQLLVAVSITIMLGSLFTDENDATLVVLAYMGLFTVYLLMDHLSSAPDKLQIQRPLRLIGFSGTMVLLYLVSFRWYWTDLLIGFPGHDHSILVSVAIISIAACIGVLLYLVVQEFGWNLKFFDWVPFIFLAIFFTGFISAMIPVILVNLLILVAGIHWLRLGSEQDNLGVLNFGLGIIAVLAACRFFDEDFTFLARGIMFIAVGVLFFIANYLTIKKRRRLQNET